MLADQYTSLYQIRDGEPRPTLEESQENLVRLMAHHSFADRTFADNYQRFLWQVREVNQVLARGLRIAWRSTYAVVHFGLLRSIAVEYEDDGKCSRERFDYDIVLHRSPFDSHYQTALVPLAPPEKPYSGRRFYVSSEWDHILTQVNTGGHTHRWQKGELWCDFCGAMYEDYLDYQHHPSLNASCWHIEHAVDVHFPLEERELIRVYDRRPDEGGILRLVLSVSDHQLHWDVDEITQMMQEAISWKQPADQGEPTFWIATKSVFDQDLSYSLIWWHAVSWPGCGIVKSYRSVGELINEWRWGLANKRVPRRI